MPETERISQPTEQQSTQDVQPKAEPSQEQPTSEPKKSVAQLREFWQKRAEKKQENGTADDQKEAAADPNPQEAEKLKNADPSAAPPTLSADDGAKTAPADKPGDKPADKPAEKPADKPADKPTPPSEGEKAKGGWKTGAKPTGQPGEKKTGKAAEKKEDKTKPKDLPPTVPPKKRPPVTPKPSPTRADELKTKYVTQYAQDKANEEETLKATAGIVPTGGGGGSGGGGGGGTPPAPPAQQPGFLSKVKSGIDEHKDTADSVVDVGTSLVGNVTDSLDLAGAIQTEKEKKQAEAEGKEYEESDDLGASDYIGGITSILGGGYNTLSGGYGLFSNAKDADKKRKSGNKVGSRLAGLDAASSAAGMLGGISSMGSGISTLAKNKEAGSVFGFVGNGMDLLSGGLDMVKSGMQLRSYNSLKKKQQDMQGGATAKGTASSAEYGRLKGAAKGKALGKDEAGALLNARSAKKRDKGSAQALEMANGLAGVKAAEGNKGIGASVAKFGAAGAGLIANIAKKIGGITGNAIGLAANAITTLGKGAAAGLSASNRRDTAKATSAMKEQMVRKVVEKKKQSFVTKKKADEADHVTDKEAEQIVVNRLNVNTPIDDTGDPLQGNIDTIYKEIASQNADSILMNSGAEKTKLLDALGLDDRADKATIMEALGAGGD